MSSRNQYTGPEAGQRVAEGFAAAADGYDATGTEFFRVMGEHLVAQAGIRPGAVVLDLGCGKGAVTIPAARAAGPGGQVTGIDLAVPMLDHARQAAEQAGLPCAGDLAYPAEILYDWRVRQFLDFRQPVCLILAMTMHFFPPDQAQKITAQFIGRLPPGRLRDYVGRRRGH